MRVTLAGAAVLALPWTLEACGDENMPRFFTDHERSTVRAIAARIIPNDIDPGASDVSVAGYVENLLTAFDHRPPLVFAGGPYSGRNPYPDNTSGGRSGDSPDNAFEAFLPLTRTQEIAWRVRIYGSKSVTGGDHNDAVLGETVGMRDVYRDGIRALDVSSRGAYDKDFVDLTDEEQDEMLAQADQGFVLQAVEHAIEGMYAAPEYGGNDDGLGWSSARVEGDSQPLGYSIYDETTGAYNEIPETPMSEPNPDEDYAGFDDEVLEFIGAIVTAVGGTRFSS
jgi:hypothetical protein